MGESADGATAGNELELTISLAFASDSTSFTVGLERLLSGVSGINIRHSRQAIATSNTAIAAGDVTFGGYFFCINRDATNFISIHRDNNTDLVRVNAGEPAIFRIHPDTSGLNATADTLECQLEYWMVEA